MKKYKFLFSILFLSSFYISATTITISTVGLNFTPQITNLVVGDTIHFLLGQNHNAVEVSQLTYSNSGSISNGGFNLPFGADTTIILSAGIYYYVCQPHAVAGMVGVISVSAGCTDPLACNYDPSAVFEDGSCLYSSISTDVKISCDTFSWNGTVYTSSGTYSYLTSNAVGCDSTATLYLTINSPTTSISSVSACDTFSWNGTVYTLSGTYSYFTSNANGCDSTATLNLIIFIGPTSSYTQSDYNGFGVSCNGSLDGSIDLSVSGGVGTHTYAWSNGSTSEDLSLVGVGTYSLVANDLNGCITTETVVITEPATLTSSYTQSDYNGFGVSCNGSLDGSIDLSVNGGVDNITYTYLWSNGATTEDLTGIGSGTYSVTVSDANGCSTAQSSVFIIEPDTLLSGVLGTSQTICYNTSPDTISTIISPSGGNQPYTYDWSIDDGSGFVNLPNNNLDWFSPSNLLDTTTYRVEYSDDYQCNTFIQFVVITILPQVEPGTIISNQFLCYDSLASDLTTGISASGGNGNFNYQWESNSNGIWNTIQGATNILYSPGFLNSSIMYKLLVNSSNDANCITRETPIINILVYDSLQVGLISSDQTICFNTVPDVISLNTVPLGADNIFSYQWEQSLDNLNWSTINGENSDSLQSNLLSTTTYFRLVVTSDFGCGSRITNTVKITVHDEFLSGSISDNDTICYLEDPNQLGSLVPASGADNNYIFQWQYNDVGVWNDINGATTTLYQPTGLSDSTDYRLVVSNTFCNEELITNTINIVVNPLPDSYPIIGDMIVCSNQSDASYTLSVTPLNYRYNWFTNDGTIVGTNQSRNCLVNWPSLPNSIMDLGVDVWIYETGCEITETAIIDLSQNNSPNKTIIEKMENTNILVCNDTTFGVQYQWGYTIIASGINVVDSTHTGQYNQFSNNIDTLSNIYWVLTSYDFGNDICKTISYYNPPPNPLEILDVENNLIVYPNPVSDILRWKGVNAKIVKLTDSMGRDIKCDIDYLNQNIDVSNIKPGIYFLNISLGKKEFINKIIVK